MSCVIFGAGKIARGFIGHLLYLSGIPFVFIEKSDALADLINERGEYSVNILGAPEKNCVVKGVSAVKFSDRKGAAKAIAEADAVFNAVGGKNLNDIIPLLADGIAEKSARGGTLNCVTCENWKNPADILRNGVAARLSGDALGYFQNEVGITEAVIMRSAIEPSAAQLQSDPLVVNVQDYWELPIDASRIKGALPKITGVRLISRFAGFLERKFYTYNAANGTVSYLGALMGYEKIADAARDARILKVFDGVYDETGRALAKKHDFPLDEQMKFAASSKAKLQNYVIEDFVERNARDPMRKLGPDDRLVGSARLVHSLGIKPENLCVAIAAAMFYENPADESAERLRVLRKERGVDGVLREVCGLDPEGEIAVLVKDKIRELKERGYLTTA